MRVYPFKAISASFPLLRKQRRAEPPDLASAHAPVDHLLDLLIVDPHRLRDGFNAADVRVGPFQDVLELRELCATRTVLTLARASRAP